MLPTLIDHMAWADARAAASIAAMPESPVRDRAIALYSHTIAIEHAWAERFEQRVVDHAQWPEWSLDAANAYAVSSAAALHSVATAAGTDGIHAIITYRSRAGIEGRNTLWEILMHVIQHGAYHRGQIALLVRDGHGIPASTDFSTYLRERSE